MHIRPVYVHIYPYGHIDLESVVGARIFELNFESLTQSTLDGYLVYFDIRSWLLYSTILGPALVESFV